MCARGSVLLGLALSLVVAACAPAARPPAASAPEPAAAAPAAPVSAASPAESPAAPPPRLGVRVGYTALVASQSISWIAHEAGIFDRHGLDVQFSYINGGPAGVASLISGELDVLVAGASSVVRGALQGSDTVMIAGTKPQLVGAIMARPEIRTPADLRGKRIGVATRASNSELVARVGLLAHGIDPEADITYLAVGSGGPRLAAMQQGTVDACGCIPPDNIAAEEAGFHLVVDVTKLGYKYVATGLAATRRKTQEQPELYRRFLPAFAEGLHRFRTDADFAIKVISEYSRVEDPRALREAYEIERQIMTADLRVDPEAMRGVLDELAATFPQAATANPDDFVEPRFQRELQASGFFDRLGR
jgi:ABC-type nitrate/sulfonate/bicarbonate transport system substrate-binding protein